MKPGAVVYGVTPPVIASPSIHRRIRFFNTHRVGAVDPEVRFRTIIP